MPGRDGEQARALTLREEEAELIQACREGHGTLYGQEDLAEVVAGLANECEVREQNERAEMQRAEEYVKAYRVAETEVEELVAERRLHHSLLSGAWNELEAAEEHHRWHHEQEGREVEPREERLGVLMELAEALDEDDGSARPADVLAGTLRYLASLHHRTLTNSKLHDPELNDNFRDCRCLPCRKAAAALRVLERADAVYENMPESGAA